MSKTQCKLTKSRNLFSELKILSFVSFWQEFTSSWRIWDSLIVEKRNMFQDDTCKFDQDSRPKFRREMKSNPQTTIKHERKDTKIFGKSDFLMPNTCVLCLKYLIRKAIWHVSNLPISKLLRNLYFDFFFQRTKLRQLTAQRQLLENIT